MYKPEYIITNKLLKYISSIDASREVILHAPLVPYWERKFQQEAVVRTIHYSTHIEDNPLSYRQVSEIVGGELEESDLRIRDYREIVNYREVLKYISENFTDRDLVEIDIKVLLRVHKILTKKIVPEQMSGSIREVPVVLVNSKTRKVSYRAPVASKVLKLLEELFDWYNDDTEDIHPVIKAGILHTQIALIHPFVEANGRTARSMATLSLFRDGYEINQFFCLEEHYDRDLPRYYEALQSVEKHNGELTIWLEYFSQGLEVELLRIKEKILSISRDKRMAMDLGKIALTERQIKIFRYIEDHNYINNQKWRKALSKYSDDTILRDLKVLMKKGLVKKQGSTKAAKYVLKI